MSRVESRSSASAGSEASAVSSASSSSVICSRQTCQAVASSGSVSPVGVCSSGANASSLVISCADFSVPRVSCSDRVARRTCQATNRPISAPRIAAATVMASRAVFPSGGCAAGTMSARPVALAAFSKIDAGRTKVPPPSRAANQSATTTGKAGWLLSGRGDGEVIDRALVPVRRRAGRRFSADRLTDVGKRLDNFRHCGPSRAAPQHGHDPHRA